MNEDPDLPDEERGLYPKYRAFKILDEEELTMPLEVQDHLGRDHALAEVTNPFLLLKFKDPDASAALLAYANAVEDRYPKMAADIREKLTEIQLEVLRAKLVGNQGVSIPLGTVTAEQLSTQEGREEVVDGILESLEEDD